MRSRRPLYATTPLGLPGSCIRCITSILYAQVDVQEHGANALCGMTKQQPLVKEYIVGNINSPNCNPFEVRIIETLTFGQIRPVPICRIACSTGASQGIAALRGQGFVGEGYRSCALVDRVQECRPQGCRWQLRRLPAACTVGADAPDECRGAATHFHW